LAFSANSISAFIWDRDDESKILLRHYGPNRKRDPDLLTPNIFFLEIRNPQVEYFCFGVTLP
jgi:hypothetical protein